MEVKIKSPSTKVTFAVSFCQTDLDSFSQPWNILISNVNFQSFLDIIFYEDTQKCNDLLV